LECVLGDVTGNGLYIQKINYTIHSRALLPPISTSDHNIVCFKRNISFVCEQQSANELSCRRNFAKADWNGICNFCLV